MVLHRAVECTALIVQVERPEKRMSDKPTYQAQSEPGEQERTLADRKEILR